MFWIYCLKELLTFASKYYFIQAYQVAFSLIFKGVLLLQNEKGIIYLLQILKGRNCILLPLLCPWIVHSHHAIFHVGSLHYFWDKIFLISENKVATEKWKIVFIHW